MKSLDGIVLLDEETAAAMRRDVQTLAKVREIAERWLHTPGAEAQPTMALLCRILGFRSDPTD